MLSRLTNLGWATPYVRTGCAVLPIQAGTKCPACAHGVKDASKDPDQVDAWFAADPTLNLGIATGPVSGLLVVDVDPRNDGEASYRRPVEKVGSLDHAPRVATPSGGTHYYLRFPDGDRLRTKLDDYPGIGFQGPGKYVVAPPSTFNGIVYRWIGPSILDGAPPESPAALVALLRQETASGSRESAFDGAGRIAEGGRNNGLTRIAGSLRRQGLDEAEIESALITFNATFCDPPLPEAEVKGIARSVSRYPAGERYACTDLGNARRLVELFGTDIRFCAKTWLVWDSTRWVKDETGAVMRMAKQMAEAILREAEMIEKGPINGK